MTLAPGASLGPYRIDALIGAGGMGEVYRARDTRLGRNVAVKSLHPKLLGKPHFASQLLREARAIAQLNHPNIAQIYDVIDNDGRVLIVMEHLEGETLAQRIRRKGSDAPAEVASLGAQMAAALEHAHAQGLLHCDLKPGNVFVTNTGVVKLVDFGLARVIDSETETTDAGLGATPTMLAMRAGTPAYMSPEQVDGRQVTEQSDIYSLGLILFELACGHRPTGTGMATPDSAETRTAAGLDAPAKIPAPLDGILVKALASSPDRRFESATSLRTALTAAAEKLAHPDRARIRRYGWVAAAALALALLGSLGGPLAQLWKPQSQGLRHNLPVVAVLPFSTADLSADSRLLATGLTELLTDNISASPALVIVSNAAVRSATGPDARPEAVARTLGAAFVVSGEFEADGDRARVKLSVFDSRKNQAMPSATFETNLTDVVSDSPTLAVKVRSLIRQAGVPVAEPPASAQNQPSRAALEDYAQGRDLLEHLNVPANLDRSIDLFDRALERDPNFALAHAALGEALWRKYRRTRDRTWATKAQSAAFDAMRLAPNEARVRYAAAVVLRGTGEPGKAIEELRHALELQPNYTDAHRLLGAVLAESGNLEEGLREFNLALALQPASPDTQHALGLAYYDAGRFVDAVDAFREETRLRPDSASAFQLMGASLQSLGRLDEALESYTRATAISPSALSYSNIGMIRYGQRRFDDAVAAYRQSAEIDPNVPETHRNLADSLARAGAASAAEAEYHRAIALADSQLQVNPKDGKLFALKAVCYAKLHQVPQARSAVAGAATLGPEESAVQYFAGVASALVGDSTQAVTFLQRALDLGYSRAIMDADDDLDTLRKSPAYSHLHSPSPRR